MKARKKARTALVAGIIGATLLATFSLNVIPFPIAGGDAEGYGRPCYSPNMEYYIERYTTLSKALFVTPSHSKSGVAILYDRSGRELYRGRANDIYKPGWFGDSVSFFGGWGAAGYSGADLPSSAGEEFVGCFSPDNTF